jgi:hypothetical protein
MLNVCKLAAIDLQFLGAKLILTEFGLGALGSIALGLLTSRAGIQRFHSRQMIAFGVYLLLLGINYVPLLLHALSMHHTGSALLEIRGEPGDKRVAFRKYRRQSLFLLLPLIVPIAAIVQEIQRRRAARSADKPAP